MTVDEDRYKNIRTIEEHTKYTTKSTEITLVTIQNQTGDNLLPNMNLQEYIGLPNTIQFQTESYRTLQDLMHYRGPKNALQDIVRPNRTKEDNTLIQQYIT